MAEGHSRGSLVRVLLCLAAVLSLAGCSTVVPVGMSTTIDPDTGPSCARACEAVKMKVAGIVFIRNMGGCVCEPAPGPAAAPRADNAKGGASAAQMGGAVLVVLEEEAARQNQQQTSTTGGSTGAGASGYGHR
jgi:hypothetical protein